MFVFGLHLLLYNNIVSCYCGCVIILYPANTSNAAHLS